MAEEKKEEKKDVPPEKEEKKDTQPEKEEKKEEKPKLESKINEKLDNWEKRQKTKKEKPKEGIPKIVSGSILDPIKESITQSPFVGSGGMWKTVINAYNSCTDDFGKLTVSLEKLQNKVYSAQKDYFEKHFGKWQVGDVKNKSKTIGDLVYKQYLGDTQEAFKPLLDAPKEDLVPELVVSKALEPLIGHYTNKMRELDQYNIVNLGKDDKEKLKDEIVERAKAVGRPLSKAELISDQSLIKSVYGIIAQERRGQYEKITEGKSLLEGLE